MDSASFTQVEGSAEPELPPGVQMRYEVRNADGDVLATRPDERSARQFARVLRNRPGASRVASAHAYDRAEQRVVR